MQPLTVNSYCSLRTVKIGYYLIAPTRLMWSFYPSMVDALSNELTSTRTFFLDSLMDVKKLIVISSYLEETSYLIQKAKKRSLAC